MKVLERKFENLEKDAKFNGWSSQVKIYVHKICNIDY